MTNYISFNPEGKRSNVGMEPRRGCDLSEHSKTMAKNRHTIHCMKNCFAHEQHYIQYMYIETYIYIHISCT